MEQMVSTVQKKTFIKWLLGQRLLKNRETAWLFNYMMGNEQLLSLVHFVDQVAGCRRAIEIAETSQDSDGFEYVKDSVHTYDPEKAFHDLRLNQDEDLFIKINLPSVDNYPEYFSIIEDGPNIGEYVHETYGQAAEDAAGAAEKAYAEDRLYKAINHALDHGDEEVFYKLTRELKALKRK